MKTFARTSKLMMFALLAVLLFSAAALTACQKPDDPDSDEVVITQYDADIDASITMGAMGEIDFGGSLVETSYMTVENGQHSLTVVFKVGELTVGSISRNIFVDDDPEDAKTQNGIVEGTIGFYQTDGTLVTDGVSKTYSSGEDYESTASGKNVYYVKSATLPVDGLRESYEITLYVNSSIMGAQFSNDTYKATLQLDLDSGKAVESISGLGVETRGEAPQNEPQAAYTQYDAELSCYVSAMGGVEFGSGLLAGVYVEQEGDQYYLTLIFQKSQVTIYTITCDTFIDTDLDSAGTSKGIPDGTIGYYDESGTLVTEGVEIGYSSGDDYAARPNGNVYYVKSVRIPVDSLRETYNLALYINSSVMGVQFCEPNEIVSTGTYSAVLTLDLESGVGVDNIDDLLGVETRGEVPEEDPQAAYTQYDAELSCYVSAMGGVEFGSGLLAGVYVEQEGDQYYLTLIFQKSQVTIYTITCDTFIDTDLDSAGASKGIPDGTIGYYDESGALVTEGVEIGYSSGDDYAARPNGNVYYVKSVRIPVDSLRETYNLALYINSSVMGVQFCEPNETVSTGTYSAVLTLDLESGIGVDNIDDLLGVETRGEVPEA